MSSNTTNDTVRELVSSQKQLLYYHADDATLKTLKTCEGKSIIFEIDVAVSFDTEFAKVTIDATGATVVTVGVPYIGHPSKFYSMKQHRGKFPTTNVSLNQFRSLLLTEYQSLKVLLDIKHKKVIPDILAFAQMVGTHRCIAHAFIADWTIYPRGLEREPHWEEEDIFLEDLKKLQSENIPLIANCRGFNNDHVRTHGLVAKMLENAGKHDNIVALGLYYAEPEKPDVEFLRGFNEKHYKAWVNANTDLQEYEGIEWVGMCNTLDTVVGQRVEDPPRAEST